MGRESVLGTASEEAISVREAAVEVKNGIFLGRVSNGVLASSIEISTNECDTITSGSEVISSRGIGFNFHGGVGVEVRLSNGSGRGKAGKSAEDNKDDSRSHNSGGWLV